MADDVLTSAEMRAAEAALFAAGLPSFDLMQRAGHAAAAVIHTNHRDAKRVAVLCGPGNNGGDGFLIAAELAERQHTVDVFTLVPIDRLKGDAARAAAHWTARAAAQSLEAFDPTHHDLIIDALFGIGLARPLTGIAADAITRVNATSGVTVVAIDVPSGVDADRGACLGAALRATETITFHRLKCGLTLEPGRSHAGPIRIVDIGVPAPVDHRVTTNAPALWTDHLPRLEASTHKYTRGHALVFAGGLEGVGAARLAARAALRIGAGLVTIACPPEALVAHAARGPDALIARAVDGDPGLDAILADTRRNALLIGPAFGLGDATRSAVTRVLAEQRATVLDADALTTFAGTADALARSIGSNTHVVLTPHAGEFARLFGDGDGADKITRTRAAAKRVSAVIVHKGPDTVIAAPDGRVAININGTPLLATAGTGDVLAGMITGFLAQGMPAFEAACAAVYRHAEAAHQIGPGLIADDLADRVGRL